MVEAVLLDFYGTVVHEDDAVIDQICATISQAATVSVTPQEVGSYWWSVFSEAFKHSFGDSFQTQRRLESASLEQTVEKFGADCDAEELSRPLFAYWQQPPVFEDATQFLDNIDMPVVVVSNIDRSDIQAAIDHHDLTFEHVITSEDVGSYKPRPELFVAGLKAVGCPASRVLHIGDSLTSDVAGAQALGIPVAWVNRSGRSSPAKPGPTYVVRSLVEVSASMLS